MPTILPSTEALLLPSAEDAALAGRVTTAETDIAALEAADVALDGRLDTAETDITALEAADVSLDGRLDTAETTITALDGRLDTAEADITALEAEIALRPEEVIGRAVQTTPQALGTTPTNIIAVTLDIPAHWASYDVEAYGTCQVVDTSGGATGVGDSVGSQVVHSSGDFNTFMSFDLMDLNYHDTHPFSQFSFVEGLTPTGNRTFTWTMTRDSTFTVSADQITFKAVAIRTS